MKRILLAGAAFAALSTASFAADMPAAYPAEASVVEAAAGDWSGFYLGIQGGYAFTEAEIDTDIAGVGIGGTTSDLDGFAIGIYSGINRQFGNWVVGVDNSLSYLDLDEEVGIGGGLDGNLEVSAFSTTRGRVGYAFDSFMIFAAGGIALANAELSGAGDDDDHLMVGYSVGGGVEAKFSGNWSARIEYLYNDFDDESFALTDDAGVTSVSDVSFEQHIVRGGLAYHF